MIAPCESGVPVRSPLGTFGLEICGRPAIARHRYSCKCGHVVERGTCAEHEPRAGTRTALVGCRFCLLVEFHDCQMTFERIEPAA